MATVILLRSAAPDKPGLGEPCNGCGVCCTVAPCPPGILVSRRIRGACSALVWAAESSMYRCGLLTAPTNYLPRALRRLAPLLARAARRYIAAGAGCDCDASARRST